MVNRRRGRPYGSYSLKRLPISGEVVEVHHMMYKQMVREEKQRYDTMMYGDDPKLVLQMVSNNPITFMRPFDGKLFMLSYSYADRQYVVRKVK